MELISSSVVEQKEDEADDAEDQEHVQAGHEGQPMLYQHGYQHQDGQCGQNSTAVAVAFEKVKGLPRLPTLYKVQKLANERPVREIPFDKILPNISAVLKHR